MARETLISTITWTFNPDRETHSVAVECIDTYTQSRHSFCLPLTALLTFSDAFTAFLDDHPDIRDIAVRIRRD